MSDVSKKQRGRPALSKKRDIVLHLRISAEDKTLLENMASKQSISTSECHRNLLMQGIKDAPTVLPEHALNLESVLRQLRPLGINLNQITKSIHEGKVSTLPVTETELSALRDLVLQLSEGVIAMLKGHSIDLDTLPISEQKHVA